MDPPAQSEYDGPSIEELQETLDDLNRYYYYLMEPVKGRICTVAEMRQLEKDIAKYELMIEDLKTF